MAESLVSNNDLIANVLKAVEKAIWDSLGCGLHFCPDCHGYFAEGHWAVQRCKRCNQEAARKMTETAPALPLPRVGDMVLYVNDPSRESTDNRLLQLPAFPAVVMRADARGVCDLCVFRVWDSIADTRYVQNVPHNRAGGLNTWHRSEEGK